MPNFTFLYTIPGPPALTLQISFDYTPGEPGQTSGPPERCYPPEPEEFEFTQVMWLNSAANLEVDVDITPLISSELCEELRERLETAAMEHLEALAESAAEDAAQARAEARRDWYGD